MIGMFEVTEQARAEMAKRRKRRDQQDSDASPLHVQAESVMDHHEKEREKRPDGPLGKALQAGHFTSGERSQATISTGQGGDHPEAMVSAPASVTVELVNLREGTFPTRTPVNATPFRQAGFHSAPANTGDTP